MGQRLNIIVLAEGAIDSENKPITSEAVREVSICYHFSRIKFSILTIFS